MPAHTIERVAVWHHSQVVRQRSATPSPPVRVRVVPPKKEGTVQKMYGSFFIPFAVERKSLTENKAWNQFPFFKQK